MKKVIAITVMFMLMVSGLAIAETTGGANWQGRVPPYMAERIFGHGHGYDRCDESCSEFNFVVGGEVDAKLYEGASILGISMDFGTEVSYDSTKELRVMGKVSPNLSPIIKPWVDKLFGWNK